MIISGNTSSLPLSTQVVQKQGQEAAKNVVPAMDDPSLTQPEDVSNAVKVAEQKVNDLNASKEAENQVKRDSALDINQIQQRNDLIETYARNSGSDTETASPAPNLSDLASIAQKQRTPEVVGGIAENNDLQAMLEQRIQDKLGPRQYPGASHFPSSSTFSLQV